MNMRGVVIVVGSGEYRGIVHNGHAADHRRAGDHPFPCKSTLRKGPKPSRTSAMKKLSALSASTAVMIWIRPAQSRPGQQSYVALFEIDQRQRVASAPRALPAKGAPNVVGTPATVGTPVWVVAHVGVLGAADTDGVEGGVMPLSGGSKLITGAERFGFRATDGGLRPPPPISVEPSGIPVGPTVDPGPMDEAKGEDAVADAAQVVGAVALMPPPSKSAVLDSPGTALPMPPDAPVVEPPIPADAPVIGLPIPVDAAVVGLPMAAGADEAPAHGAPIKGAAPDVVGLTPGVASSVAPRGIPVCPTGALGMPSGDVMPSAGRGETFRRACA